MIGRQMIGRQIFFPAFLLRACLIGVGASFLTLDRSIQGCTQHHSRSVFSRHRYDERVRFFSKKKHKNLGLSFRENEFSRTVQPDRIVKTKRDYSISVQASNDECEALANRFDLSKISSLQSSLTLRRERIGSTRSEGIEVEGTVTARVTQTCVRTNEDFQVDLEFPLYCIVRPTSTLFQETDAFPAEKSLDERSYKNNKRGNIPSMKNQNKRNLDELDVMELQRLLQEDISANEDVLMEDEAIYPASGLLDVGELVSQLFWLKLDPYPKKPGTDPIRASITG